MTVRPGMVLASAAVLTCMAIGVGWARLERARTDAASALDGVTRTAAACREVVQLRMQMERVSPGQRPPEDLIAQISAALEASGVAQLRLKDLSPDSDAAIGAGAGAAADIRSSLRRQTVRVTLEPLTPAELGSFLARWRSAQPTWTVSAIELTHTGGPGDAEGVYSARLALTNVYVTDTSLPSNEGRP